MSPRDKKEVDFSPPDASDYKARIDAAKSGHIPVGGVEMPSMPRLDQDPRKGNRHRGIQEPMAPQDYQAAVATGQAIPGVGGAYAVNQPRGFQAPAAAPNGPQMAVSGKDGAMANPPRTEGGLTAQTKEAIQAVERANTVDDKGNLPKEEEDFIAQLGNATTDMLHDKKRREFIESRITDDLSFEDLLFHQELRQRVPIRKGFLPTFRTPSAAEDLFIKRLIAKDENTSQQYIIDRFAAMGLTIGLFALNEKTLADHLDANRNPDEKLFEAKFNMLMKYPLVLLADLSANFIWFEERVKKLLSLETIKGF